jgi:dihydrofolate reductase
MIIGLFAVDEANGMGINNHLPWPKNKDDMNWFKVLTKNQTVVMGSNTWNSSDMIKPLPGRRNVVITSQCINMPKVTTASGDVVTILHKIAQEDLNKQIFVIGGANILMQAEPVMEKIYITRIPGRYKSDTFIDLVHLTQNFTLMHEQNLGSCTVEHYERH